MAGVDLPRRGHLPTTGEVDAIERYYAPGIGLVFRRRLAWMRAALPPGELGRVLEVGYGSGVFQYTLAPRAGLSVGIDVHPRAAAVRERLAADGVRAELVRGDGAALPFADASFDLVVLLSALEFVPDPAACLRECLRVTVSGGRVLDLSPRILPWADRLYRRLAGFDPESEFRGGRQRVAVALADPALRLRRSLRPRWLPAALAPYELIALERP